MASTFAKTALAVSAFAGVALAPAASASSMQTYFHDSEVYSSKSSCQSALNSKVNTIQHKGGKVLKKYSCSYDKKDGSYIRKSGWNYYTIEYNARVRLLSTHDRRFDDGCNWFFCTYRYNTPDHIG